MVGNYSSRIRFTLFIKPAFLACFTIFLIVEGLQKSGVSIPFVHWYINDLVTLPILLTLSLFIESALLNQADLEYDFYRILAALILVSVCFEIIFPLTSTDYTADPMDVVAYITGGLFYYKFMRKHKKDQAVK